MAKHGVFTLLKHFSLWNSKSFSMRLR